MAVDIIFPSILSLKAASGDFGHLELRAGIWSVSRSDVEMTWNATIGSTEAAKDITLALLDNITISEADRQDPVSLATTVGLMYAIIHDVVTDPQNYLKK